ncbi:hypothetical protein [Desulfobacula sp.]
MKATEKDIEETGLVGVIMLTAGIIGAAVIPIFSDKSLKRKPFLIVGAGQISGIIFIFGINKFGIPSFLLD